MTIRVVLVDENGLLVDGDQILYVLATAWKEEGRLHGPVVGTVMSNLGLEHALRERDIEFHRASVGDRYVLEEMRRTRAVLGGEQSGHILLADRSTGDGLRSALQLAAAALSRLLPIDRPAARLALGKGCLDLVESTGQRPDGCQGGPFGHGEASWGRGHQTL